MNKQTEALKLALEALRDYRRSDDDRVSVAMGILQEALAEQSAQQQEPVAHSIVAGALFDFMGWLTSRNECLVLSSTDDAAPAADAIKDFAHMRNLSIDNAKVREWQEHLASPPASKTEQQEPVAWISVKDALPKAVRGVSYNASLTDVVLVRHSDRPDYPITAHAVVGEGLGAGIAIPTEGASEHPEIAWYSASSNLNNPFDLKNDDYERYLPKIFGSKITHWKPIDTSPPASKPWVGLTDEDLAGCDDEELKQARYWEAKLKEKNT